MLLQRLALRAAVACALATLPTHYTPAAAAQLTVVLICPASVAPSDCTRETASDVILGGRAPTPYGCLFGGLTTISRMAEGETLVDHYAMTRCEGRPD